MRLFSQSPPSQVKGREPLTVEWNYREHSVAGMRAVDAWGPRQKRSHFAATDAEGQDRKLDVGVAAYLPTKVISTLAGHFPSTELNFISS